MKKTAVLGRILGLAWIAAVAACTGGAPTPTAPPAPTPTLDTPAGSGLVATLPTEQFAQFSWSPFGRYLLVANQDGSSVYDRHGRLVSQFNGLVGWLDESHVIGPDGVAREVHESQGLGYVPNAWVVANGHGTAMVVTGVPGCVGDPMIAWYRDGSFDLEHQETLTPLGYSPDGDLALEGHMTCGAADAELHGWKGDVDVVDTSSGRTISTLHGIRGLISFDLYGKSLAAQSDSDLVIATGGESQITTLKDVRMLAWLNESQLALAGGQRRIVNVLDTPEISTSSTEYFGMRSPGNSMPAETPTLRVSWQGKVLGVDGPNGLIIDLSGLGLTIGDNPMPAADHPVATGLRPRNWSPDGRMLALRTADETTIVLMSVDPVRPERR